MDQNTYSGQSSFAKLRDRLATYFNLTELQNLCQDLGVEYESLPGQSRDDKTRELVAYMQRYARIEELRERCRVLRPLGDWPDLPLGSSVSSQSEHLSNGAQTNNLLSYHLSAAHIDVLTTICTEPGYHLVLAEAGFGKTALMRYLDRQRRPNTAIYSFSRVEGNVSIDPALRSLREQLRVRANLISADDLSLFKLIQQAARNSQPRLVSSKAHMSFLLILIDGIDECEHSERALFPELLPPNLPSHVGVVVTLRSTVRAAIEAHFAPGHPLRQSARIHTLRPLDSADIRRILLEQHHIYAAPTFCQKVKKKVSAGHPAAVIWFCRELDRVVDVGYDLDEALRRTPALRTLYEVFAREIDEMERLCAAQADRLLLRRILSMLAAAGQPPSLALLAELLEEPEAMIQDLFVRLDRYFFRMGDGSLAFSHPQFVEYLIDHDDWRQDLADARERWAAWATHQAQIDPLVAEVVARAQGDLPAALAAYERPWLAGWAVRLSAPIQSYAHWQRALYRAWDLAESQAAGPDPEELLLYALLITSWPHSQSSLPSIGAPSSDHTYRLLLTDQLRDATEPARQIETRDAETLIGLLAGDPADVGQPHESFLLLVSELGYAWRSAAGQPQPQFARILRQITQAACRRPIFPSLATPRANLLDALSALAPAIRHHFPAAVDRICQLVDAVIRVFP